MRLKNFARTLLFWLLSLTTLSFQSCDPARILALKTSNKPNLSVAIYGNKAILPEPDGDGKLAIHLPSGDARRDTSFFYGIGGWSDEKVMELSKEIDSIEIRTADKRLLIKGQATINQYLLQNRKGFGGSQLIIEAR